MRIPAARYRCPISLFGENWESIVVTLVSGIVASMVTLSARSPLPGREEETAALAAVIRERARAPSWVCRKATPTPERDEEGCGWPSQGNDGDNLGGPGNSLYGGL